MKLWIERQIFFIVDSEFCRNEADDPKDAIMYFYPPDTTDAVRCTLCCHIMGICHFMKMTFSPVTLIRLTKGKFAIKIVGRYILALKGNPDMPDSVLQRQLHSMLTSFRVHYKSFKSVWTDSVGQYNIFLEKMAFIWSMLLSASQHHGDTLALTFNVIPTLDLPKTAGLLFLQASQFLQACQRFPGVYSGCLFCDKKVLCSQLPPNILEKFSFIREKQTLLGIAVPVTYDIPGNVKLTYIYLTKQELEELKLTKMSLKLEKKPVFESLKTETLLSNEPTTSKAASELAESYADVPTVISQEHCQSNNVIKNENSDVSSSEFDSSTVLHNIYNEERERVSANFKDITTSYDCRTEARASNRHLSYDEPFTTSCDSLTTTSIPETSGTCSSELAHIESPGSTLDEDEGTDANQYVLYLQGYNDTLLILLLDQKTSEDATVIHGLWKLGMNTLMTLETDVRSCLEMAPNKFQDSNANANHLYLQFDSKWNKVRGDLKIAKNGNQCIDEVFNQSVQLLHEDFLRRPEFYETTVCARGRVIYGHKMGSRETYFHFNQPVSEHSSGFQLQSDQMCTISTKARKILEREYRIVLL